MAPPDHARLPSTDHRASLRSAPDRAAFGYDPEARRRSPPWPSSRPPRRARPPRSRPRTWTASGRRSGRRRCSRPRRTTTRPSTTGSARRSSSATGSPSAARRKWPSRLVRPARHPGRERHPRPRPRRPDPRLLQRLPPPGHRGRGARVRQGRPLPVPVPRLDLRPRRPAHPGQAHRGPRGVQLRHVRADADPVRDVGRLRVPVPLRRRDADAAAARIPRRLVRAPRGLRARPVHAPARGTPDYDVGANWKIVAENYSECYHCPGVHPLLNKLTPYDLGEDFLAEGPWKGGWMVFADGCETMSVNGQRDGRPLLYARDEDEARRIYYYILWPNLIVSVHPDYVLTHQAWPDGPNRSTSTAISTSRPTRSTRSTSPARSSSGTPPTARTTTSSSCSSRGRARGRGRRAATRTRRRRSTRSTSWSRTATRTTARTPSAAGAPRPRPSAGS